LVLVVDVVLDVLVCAAVEADEVEELTALVAMVQLFNG
jgi:hypothetical protein